MLFERILTTGTTLAVVASFFLNASAATAERFRSGDGLADPAMAINATGYVKWGQSTAAPFIDRMKGAFSWTGRMPTSGSPKQGSRGAGPSPLVAITDPAHFTGNRAPVNVTFRDNTLIDLYRLMVSVVFQRKMISYEQNRKIEGSPGTFFKLEKGPGGVSQLVGRLKSNDRFVPIVRFDRDIGMNLQELRRKGHLRLTRHDLGVTLRDLALDKNGWPTRLPTDITGRSGTVSTSVLWYPRSAASAPDNIYAGVYYLLADGTGTFSLIQRGKGKGLLALKNVRVQGPTAIKLNFRPNSHRSDLTISETDPAGTGDYLRNIRIVHERHLTQFEAGEIFTPEYVDFMADYRVIRWMDAMDGHKNPPFFSRPFEDRPKLDFYSFNQGTRGTERNGIPIDAIIAFSNKTGTDPWITVPVNVSDEFARGMAAYVAANLDPNLKVYVELGNENWNGIFPSYQFSVKAALKEWGEIAVSRGSDGKLTVTRPGRFVSKKTLKQIGFSSPKALTKALGLKHPVMLPPQGWIEWSAMRGTQLALIFEEAFARADPANGKARVVNVMGTLASWPRASDLLMKATFWRQADPQAWVDPKSVFEAIATGAYFGSYMGYRHSDMVTNWIKTVGHDRAKWLAFRHLSAGLDPNKPYYRLSADLTLRGGRLDPDKVIKGIVYTPELIIDVWPLLQHLHPSLKRRMRSGAGVRTGKVILAGPEAAEYLRVTDDGPNTVLQVRAGQNPGSFHTVAVFKGRIGRSLDQLIADGIVLPRSLDNMEVEAGRFFGGQMRQAKALGMDLIAYEGGQHLAAATWGAFSVNLKNQPLIKLLNDMNVSPGMAYLYDNWLKAWRDTGGGLFVHFADIGTPSRFGFWGLITHLGQDAEPSAALPKLDSIRRQNTLGSWWREDRAPYVFQQGISATTPAGAGQHSGTGKHDFMLAGPKTSGLSGGPGDDRLHSGTSSAILDGGSGDDVLVLGSLKAVAKGGSGRDVVKAGGALKTFDLAAIKASEIEAIDIRNIAKTTFRAKPADVRRVTGGNNLTLYAERADTLSLQGFKRSASKQGADGFTAHYQAKHGGSTVSIFVVTDVAPR